MRNPLYRQLVHTLMEEIAAGRYPDGRLPSEATLLTQYQVSRSTLREALGTLSALGIVQKRQGSGNRIMMSAFELCCRLDEDRRFYSVIRRLGHEPSCVRSVRADAHNGLHFEEWLLADGRPSVRNRMHMPDAPSAEGLDLSDASLQQADIIEQIAGVRPVHAVVRFLALQADEKLQNAFQLGSGGVHLRLSETYHDLFDKPLATSLIDLHPDCFHPALIRRGQTLLTAVRTAPVTLVERIE